MSTAIKVEGTAARTPIHVQGQPVRIPLHARAAVGTITNRVQAARLVTGPYDQAPAIRLGEQVLTEEWVAEMLGSDNPANRRLALNALSDRMQLFGDLLTGHRTVQLAATFPDVRYEGLPVAVLLNDTIRQTVDMRWTALFTTQDRRQEPWPGYFKLRDLYHAVSVRRYEPGERIELGFIEAAEDILEHYLYGTGLQWNQLLMAGRWERQEGIAAMQTKWANNLAKLAYLTLTASGVATTAYDTTGADVTAKDINTINAAALTIRQNLYNANAPQGGQDVEEDVPEDQPYYLLYNSHTAGYEDRITNALQVRYTIAQQGGAMTVKEVNRPVVPVGSPYVPTGNWYLTLPRRKNVFSSFRDLRFYDFMDARIAGVAEGEVGWGSFRFVRGDVNQVQKLALS
jgi:hypothetical protein